jgi:hypothetical protein
MQSKFSKSVACLSLALMTGWAVCVYSQVPGDGANGMQNVLSVPVSSNNTGQSVLSIQKPGINLKKMSLLDPERFTMKQSYMMNFSSTGGNGGVMGMYLNTMEYRFNAPLVMRLQVAYQTQTGIVFGNKDGYSGLNNLNQGRLFVPAFDIVYKPFKNTTFGFSYRDVSGMGNSYNPYSPYSSYGYGYGRSGFGYDMMGYSPFMRY